MEYAVRHADSFPMLELGLQQGEKIVSKPEAVVAISSALDVRAVLQGGFFKGAVRRALAGESFIFREITAVRGEGRVLLAPDTPGGLAPFTLICGYGLMVRKDGFLACSSGILVENAVRGMLRGLFSSPGFSLLRLTGQGVAFVCGWGAIHEVTLKEGEDLAVDLGHLTAWTEGMRFSVEKAGRRWIAGQAPGEALLCRFRGPGTLLAQTRRRPGR